MYIYIYIFVYVGRGRFASGGGSKPGGSCLTAKWPPKVGSGCGRKRASRNGSQ